MASIEDYHQTLLAAQGYCELGMFADSLVELDGMPKKLKDHPAVVEARLIVLMQAERWREALKVGQQLTKLAPDRNIGYIHTAYCLHEIGHTEKARSILLSGPETLKAEPVFHYNLACYECTLGNKDMARVHLMKSVELDKKFRDFAKKDPDLAPLHVEL
jgi:predicted Zn-dependent protease